MFCTKCGKKLPENAQFCTACGNPVKKKAVQPQIQPLPEPIPGEILKTDAAQRPQSSAKPIATEHAETKITETHTGPVLVLEQEAVVSADPSTPDADASANEASSLPPVPPEAPPDPTPEDGAPEPPAKKKSRIPLVVALCLVLLAAVAGGLYGYHVYSVNQQFSDLMEKADSYTQANRLERAESAYTEALTLKPTSATATVGLAQVYLMDERFQEAVDLLGSVTPPETDPSFEAHQRLLSIALFQPEIAEVDTANFPVVTVTLTRGGALALAQADVRVTEGGIARELSDFQTPEGGIAFSYTSDEAGYESETRTLEVALVVDDFTFPRTEDYDTPFFFPANLKLVSTDVSEYPLVRAFFRVEDSFTGETIPDLGPKAFLLQERVQGGEYLAREVKAVSPLEGKVGLNIALVADKSSSIAFEDMDKIKQVMVQFVTSLHYNVGDKAEVLAFDSIVQQMCTYTDDATLLTNGINNMSTDGMTALYDAIYAGINHAALQGGARCVIAFTDGMDNMSNHSYNEVISYANTQQVPIYIVGVGSSVETYALQTIADSTGGRYWFIDDLSDLQIIFNDVYAEQKELYEVTYESDAGLDAYGLRELEVTVTGGGYKAEDALSFQPVRTINDNGGVNVGNSRYMLFKESLSWEQATQRCQEMGGHLATITSQAEMDQLTQMADAEGVMYLWLGGYTSYDSTGGVFGHWVTGEDFSYAAWGQDEPSRVDQDGTEEWYIMLWNVPSLGGWNWNDQRGDPAAVVTAMAKDMGFICEFENGT